MRFNDISCSLESVLRSYKDPHWIINQGTLSELSGEGETFPYRTLKQGTTLIEQHRVTSPRDHHDPGLPMLSRC